MPKNKLISKYKKKLKKYLKKVKSKKLLAVVLSYAKYLAVALGIALVIRTMIIQNYQIPTGSMSPTIRIGDRVCAYKAAYGLRNPFTGARLTKGSPLKRGDIVVFSSPYYDGRTFVKRCIALPGETVEIRNRDVYINSKLLTEPYTYLFDSESEVGVRDNLKPVVVPPGKYLFLGDNRDDSRDGRFFGFIEDESVLGKAVYIFWPLKRAGSLK